MSKGGRGAAREDIAASEGGAGKVRSSSATLRQGMDSGRAGLLVLFLFVWWWGGGVGVREREGGAGKGGRGGGT